MSARDSSLEKGESPVPAHRSRTALNVASQPLSKSPSQISEEEIIDEAAMHEGDDGF